MDQTKQSSFASEAEAAGGWRALAILDSRSSGGKRPELFPTHAWGSGQECCLSLLWLPDTFPSPVLPLAMANPASTWCWHPAAFTLVSSSQVPVGGEQRVGRVTPHCTIEEERGSKKPAPT